MRMTTEKRIATVDLGSAFGLCCPRCNWEYLHQRGVTVFHRKEDESKLVRTVVHGADVSLGIVDSEGSGNPSDRRQGLAVQFECEQCGGDEADNTLELTIAQQRAGP
jgi:hypothetical protein